MMIGSIDHHDYCVESSSTNHHNLLWPESYNSTFFLAQPPPPPPPEDALLMQPSTVDVCHYEPDLLPETRVDLDELLKYELDELEFNLEEEDPAFAAFLEGVITEDGPSHPPEEEDLQESQQQHHLSSMAIQPTVEEEEEEEEDPAFAAFLEGVITEDGPSHPPEEEDLHESQQQNQLSSMAIQPTEEEEEDWTMGLPSGMKFRPTDVELINNYLKVEYVNGYIPRGIISTLDVYDYQPDQLPALAADHGDGKFYFFTRVKKLGKSKCDRTVKSKTGFWKANQSKLIKDEKGIRIGSKMSLTYYNNNKIKTQWLMTEYKLESTSEHSSDYELVLAVVYYHQRRND